MSYCFNLGCQKSANPGDGQRVDLGIDFQFIDWNDQINTAQLSLAFCSQECEQAFGKNYNDDNIALAILDKVIEAHKYWRKNNLDNIPEEDPDENIKDAGPLLSRSQNEQQKCRLEITIPTQGELGISQALLRLKFNGIEDRRKFFEKIQSSVAMLNWLKGRINP